MSTGLEAGPVELLITGHGLPPRASLSPPIKWERGPQQVFSNCKERSSSALTEVKMGAQTCPSPAGHAGLLVCLGWIPCQPRQPERC